MQVEADRFGDAVADYLAPWRNELKSYAWPMSASARRAAEKLGFSLVDADARGGAAATHALRAAVAAWARELHILRGGDRETKLAELCSFVIKDWGGLRSNSHHTIGDYSRTYTSGRAIDWPILKVIRTSRGFLCWERRRLLIR